jgi:hypothetical protein
LLHMIVVNAMPAVDCLCNDREICSLMQAIFKPRVSI